MMLSRAVRRIALVVGLGAVCAVAFWAGRESLTPPSQPAETPLVTLYSVVSGELGRSLKVSVLASRSTGRELRANSSGTVTSVDAKLGPYAQGDVLMRVNLRPSVVAEGPVPSFRDLKLGDTGSDVQQLQSFLGASGHQVSPTGLFDRLTEQSVEAWQSSLGLPTTGVVQASDILYLPHLPAALDLRVSVGNQVGPDTVVAKELSDDLLFTSVVSTSTAIPIGTPIAIAFATGTWQATVVGVSASESSTSTLTISSVPGGPTCSRYCANLTGPGPFELPASLILVPSQAGPVVPIGAILTDASGRQSLQMGDGLSRQIDVLATDGGLAIVRGVRVGEIIKLPSAP